MDQQSIDCVGLTVSKLFDDFYIVPAFQRQYVWQDNNVELLFNDIYDQYAVDLTSTPSDYFIGSIVVCPRHDKVFELIDGQQRITTSYLLLCAIKH